MPVSPQDFELYSRMTGAPMPTDAMSRMQMAPEVFKFTKDFAKKPNILEKTGNLVKNIGRNTLVGAGLLAGMDLENQQRQQQELMRSEADKAQSEAVTMGDPVEEVAPEPELTAVEKGEKAKRETAKFKTDEMIRLEKARAKLRNITDENIETYSIPANPTTADTYGQDYVPNQTSSNIVDRKISQGSQIADSIPNVAEVLSESQDSRPVDFADPVKVQQQMEAEMVGKSKGIRQLSKYMGTKGLDKALIGAFTQRKIQEEMFGEALSADSDLLDHPDVKDVVGGEEPNPRLGTNTSPTTNLQEQTGGGESLNEKYMEHADEMRRMEAQERRKRKSPSERQVNLLEQRAIDNQEAIDSGFMSMSDEERANETARLGGDRIREMAETSPDAISETDLKRTGVLSGQLTRFPAGEETEKATERKRLRRERNAKAEDFKAKFVEGALSDIVRGKRGNQSLGITRIPATNGEAQTGFVLANKPLDQSPTSATTYGFGVDAGGEDYLKNQLGEDTFSTYMDRGMKEARQGKKRKAGEIFSYLTEPVRVVSGRAQLGNFGVIDPNFDLPSRRD